MLRKRQLLKAARQHLDRQDQPDDLAQFVFPERNKFMAVLEALILAVEDAGGVIVADNGELDSCRPVSAKRWPALGAVYVQACRAIGRTPQTVREGVYGDDD
jgi:hypothetical protein